MAGKLGSRSIVLEILIVLLSILLVVVILVPDKIWKEEEATSTACRNNLNALFEVERYYYRQTGAYTDTLAKLVNYVKADSSLQKKKQIVEFTNELYHSLNGILDVPILQQILIISKSLEEIRGDLRTNERYFRKYENLNNKKFEIEQELTRFEYSFDFPRFNRIKIFVDSLNNLKNSISDYPLQKAALYAQKYLDSVLVNLPAIEKNIVEDYWAEENAKINQFISEINKTDIRTVSSVGDRLKKFTDRINNAFQNIKQLDLQYSLQMVNTWKTGFEKVYQKFLNPSYFMITQRYGLLALSETDSILLHFNQNNFVCPDNAQRYLVSYRGARLTVECPNLLDTFQGKLQAAAEPIKNARLFQDLNELNMVLDSTRNLLDSQRLFIRRYTDILLNVKEILAEIDNLPSVRFYKYASNLGSFLDTIQTEKRISVLKPMIEELLNPMDTLATRLETGNLSDLESKIQYFGQKIQELDSLVASTRLPRRIRRNIVPIYPAFEPAYSKIQAMKQNLGGQTAAQIRAASKQIEKALLEVLEGEKERVYVIFFKKHINHGYIQEGAKSWEEES